MFKKVVSIALIVLILFSVSVDTFARSRSFSLGRSFSSSRSSGGGWFGSSSSKSSGSSWFGSSSKSSSSSGSSWFGGSSSSSKSSSKSGWFGGSSSSSSKSGSSSSSSKSSAAGSSSSKSSSSRGVPGSYSSSSAKSTASGSSNSLKSKYLSDSYKKEASKNNYNKYKQKLNSQQQKSYNSSMNNNFNYSKRMSYEDAVRTRASRVNAYNSRPIYINVSHSLFPGALSYGYASAGIWDLWFLTHLSVSSMFWYHHWSEISMYRNYFDAQRYAELEARVKQLEAQNVARDPQYLDPDTDPDLQLSPDYQQKHLDSMYYSDRYPDNAGNPVVTVVLIGVGVVVLVLLLRRAMRPKRKRFDSSIY